MGFYCLTMTVEEQLQQPITISMHMMPCERWTETLFKIKEEAEDSAPEWTDVWTRGSTCEHPADWQNCELTFWSGVLILMLMFRVCLLTVSMGVVSSPQAKNSRKITTTAWVTLARPRPCCGGEKRGTDINYSSVEINLASCTIWSKLTSSPSALTSPSRRLL